MFLNLTPTPKIAHLAPESEKQPKSRTKLKVRIEGSIENNSFSATGVELKTVFQS